VATKKFTSIKDHILKNMLIAAVAATMLCACGFMTPVQQYAGDVRDASGIAVIQGHVGNPFSDEYHATITGYTKMESPGPGEQRKFGIPGFTDYPSEIHVIAGEYRVQVYCFKGFSSYRPSTALPVQAGKTYLLKCEVRDGQATIGVHASAT
jgi:hypothetical protein